MQLEERRINSILSPSSRGGPRRHVILESNIELRDEDLSSEELSLEIQSQTFGNTTYSYIRTAGKSTFRDRCQINKSFANHYLLSLQIEGQCRLLQDGRIAVLKQGEMALYDATRPYELTFEDGFKQLVVKISRDAINGRVFDAETITAQTISGSRGIGRLAYCLFTEIAQQANDLTEGQFVSAHTHALDFLSSAIAKQMGRQAKRITDANEMLVRRAVDYVESTLREETLSVSDVATALGVSDRYLRKSFQDKKHSLSEWIWLRRLENARIDLGSQMKANKSIMSIAFSWGFKDAAHFSRAFKKRFGCSPRQYRSNSVAILPISKTIDYITV